jgi:hypothetical protein
MVDYLGGTSFKVSVNKSGNWSGAQVSFQIVDKANTPCGYVVASKTQTMTGSNIFTHNIDLSCAKIGPNDQVGLMAIIKSPATCTYSECTYQTGYVSIRRYN